MAEFDSAKIDGTTLAAGAERLRATVDACEAHLPQGSQFTRPAGGMHLWVRLPGGIDTVKAIGNLRDTLDQPLVGVQPDGNFVYSMLKYGLRGAVVQPIKGKMLLSAAFVSALKDQKRFVSVGRYALRGVGRPQELFTIDPAS